MRTTALTYFLFLLFTQVSFSQVNLENGLVACYAFNGNADDLTGNNPTGRIVRAIPTEDRFGEAASAYAFAGFDYIDLDNDFDFPSRTVNLWFNVAQGDNDDAKVIYDSDHPGLSNAYTKIRVVGGEEKKLRLSARNENIQINLPIQENKWYMATITVENSVVTYYLDGCFVARLTEIDGRTSGDGSLTVSLGTTRVFDRFFVGKIDDLTIYNRAISAEEAKALFTDGSPCSPTIVSSAPDQGKSDDPSMLFFPNPSSGFFSIENTNLQNPWKIEVYNQVGVLVFESSVIRSSEFRLDCQSWPKGIYFLRASSRGRMTVAKKLILE